VILCAKPAPALRQFIRYYCQLEADLAGTTVLQPVPARSPQVLEFTFGTPYEFHSFTRGQLEPTHSIAVVGAQTCRAGYLAIRGQVEAFTIVFQPAGLQLLSPLPAESVTGNHFEGEAILGRGIAELRCRLEDAGSFGARVQAANIYLCRQRSSLDSLSCIARAATEVILSDGCVRVSELANKTGIGIRQFERRFRHEIGITPKLYARIVRFEAALQRKAAKPGTLWTDIACDLGYHDQMHMVHDFNHLAGTSPTAIASQLEFFLAPEITAANSRDQPHAETGEYLG
jgi:AraC-like DNA-binding protein